MRLRRLTLSATDPHARGAEYGARAGVGIRRGVASYRHHYLRWGGDEEKILQQCQEIAACVERWSADQAAGMQGLAAGTGLTETELYLLVARTEILATLTERVGECSTAVVAPAHGAPYSVQTWDWDPDLAPEGLLLEFQPAPSRAVATFTEHGMPAKIGVNSDGLGVHLNILHHRSDGVGAGVPVHCLIAEVLARATTVEEAQAIVSSAPLSASSVLTLLDATGGVAALELSPDGIGVLRPESGVLWHTNHFLHPRLADGERGDPATTYARADHLRSRTDELAAAGRSPTELAVAMCGPDGADSPICLTAGRTAGPWETLLTAAITVDPPRLALHPHNPSTVGSAEILEAFPCAT